MNIGIELDAEFSIDRLGQQFLDENAAKMNYELPAAVRTPRVQATVDLQHQLIRPIV